MSKKKVPILLFAIGIVLVSLSIGWFIFSQQFGSAAITVESIPEANVYINEELVGRTPYKGEFKAGEVEIKLLPLAFDSPRIPYEANVKLTAGVETIVRRALGETELDSAGEIISFEKGTGNNAAITVVSSPDNSQVMLEGRASEHSPVRFIDIEPGTYSLAITAENYTERSFSVVPRAGYTLTAIVDLAKVPASQEQPAVEETTQEVEEQQTIVILSTPTGFLRVREEASTSAKEVAQVEPGDEFRLLETSEDGKWYRIESGWISSEYAEIKQ